MSQPAENDENKISSRRLSKPERRQQLLDMAREVIRNEGADRLTLGYLATQAGVSKPITYEHFGTRAGLLTALCRELDRQQTEALRHALKNVRQDRHETASVLASAYIHCAADTSGEWHAVSAALAGSGEMSAVHQELITGYVQLFAAALTPHCGLAAEELQRRCVGSVGAGEALSMMMIGNHCSEAEAASTFAGLICGALG